MKSSRTTFSRRFFAVAAASVLSACSGDDALPLQSVVDGQASVSGRGVLVIVIDGLRWDHTSLAGYDRDTTPFLKRFAQSGIVFEDTWAPTASLLGSHIAILSGCDPSIAQPPSAWETSAWETSSRTPSVRNAASGAPRLAGNAWFIPEGLQLLSQPFLGAGWQTAAFVDHPMIAQLRGFDRGFVDFIEFGGNPSVEDREIGVFGVGRRYVKWLNGLPIEQDWFAYIHMNDLERVWTENRQASLRDVIDKATASWKPRAELARVPPLGFTEPILHALPPTRARAGEPLSLAEYELRYDRGLRAMDASLQRLIGHTDEFERSDLITVVIAGSFGTGLGEHGLYLQAGLMEDEDLHVPLVIRPSKALREELGWGTEGGRATASLASLTDLAPTLVDLNGLRMPAQMHGVSLRSSMVSPPVSTRSRVFVASRIVPGVGVVDANYRFARYGDRQNPFGAGGGEAQDTPSSLPLLGGARETLENRRPSVQAPGSAQKAAYRALGVQWESLLLDQRRWLHFGRGEADTSPVDQIRALQLTLGVPNESHREPRSPDNHATPTESAR